ncbi:MAG: hypothetical protein KDH92_05920 [Chloroflexi bacterium]|nr:hypothetical protein [Chloroflexota bacterium]
MRVEEVFVTIAALMAFSIPFILVGYIRRLRYEELVTLAEQGLLREDLGWRGRRGNGKAGLRWGIVLTALGVALSCGLWPIGFVVDGFPLGLGPWMLLGFLPTAFGIALLLIHRLAGEDEAGRNGAAASMPAISDAGDPDPDPESA